MLYRKCGLEFVDHMKWQVEGHTKLEGLLAQAYFAELTEIAGREKGLIDSFAEIEYVAGDAGEDEIDQWYESR